MSDTEVIEEHDVLVHVDFDSRIDDDCFENLKQFKLIGIETAEPILQIGDQVFKGKWKEAVGTHVFLEEDDMPDNYDIFSENFYSHVRFLCKTDKLLTMQRVFVSHNQKDSENTDVTEETVNVTPSGATPET